MSEGPGAPLKIVSGGQTGVDRAALDAAMELGLPCGGWCPYGRRAEDGRISDKYPLRETKSPGYMARTKKNVGNSDGTLILTLGRIRGGTRQTVIFARELARPYLVVNMAKKTPPDRIRDWICKHEIQVLNVAGPRESKKPGVYKRARKLLQDSLAVYTTGD